MIGLILVTHGRLGHEFLQALEHVVGPQMQIQAISIGPEDVLDDRRGEIKEAVARVDSGQGVIVLTDMFGGTPSNLALSVMQEGRIEVVAGVNLPLLIKLSSLRKESRLQDAIEKARDSGRKYINIASAFLTEKE